jgi:hypothetical protein
LRQVPASLRRSALFPLFYSVLLAVGVLAVAMLPTAADEMPLEAQAEQN